MNKVIEIASGFTGKKDNPIYREWFYGKNGVTTPDCAVFVDYCYAHAGHALGKGDFTNGWASVPHMLFHYRSTGEITQTPQEGDIVIMGWDGKTPMHVGLFQKFNADGTVHTVEANTSNPTAKSTSEENGGWTMEKNRQKKFILAYIHPKVLDQIS